MSEAIPETQTARSEALNILNGLSPTIQAELLNMIDPDTQRTKKTDDQKQTKAFLDMLTTYVKTEFSKSLTSFPERVRDDLVKYLTENILKYPHPNSVNEENLSKTISDALELANKKRQKEGEEEKMDKIMSTYLKNLVTTVNTRATLSDEYKQSFDDLVGAFPYKTKGNDPETDKHFDSVIEDGKAAAEKEIENRKKSAEKAKLKKAAKKAKSEANTNAVSEEEVVEQYNDEVNAVGKRERTENSNTVSENSSSEEVVEQYNNEVNAVGKRERSD